MIVLEILNNVGTNCSEIVKINAEIIKPNEHKRLSVRAKKDCTNILVELIRGMFLLRIGVLNNL